jgi:hypothetical protein
MIAQELSTYHVIGLSNTEIVGNSYKTYNNDRIMHDENGRGISIQKLFPQYTLYVVSTEDPNYEYYYSIQLSQSDCGSFGGRLGHCGSIKISMSDFAEARQNITHFPVKPLSICEDLEGIQKDLYLDTQIIYTKDDPTICLFSVSDCGGDEQTPNGWIHVNMELFFPITPRSRI